MWTGSNVTSVNDVETCRFEIGNLEAETNDGAKDHLRADDLTMEFEQLVVPFDQINVARLWEASTETARRKLRSRP